ncbi:MAG: hypothetical protein P8J45_10030 [Phycisphaerales bacterium]|nr:hypothetical protein [Phycisphaerales bacterium]
MSSQDTMKSSELRELADLDALGLLDEVDSHRFEQAFSNATIAEQETIRTRQSTLLQRLVGDPTDELPVDLKDRVLGAVRQEIERQDEQLAPIATIGRRRRERSLQKFEAATPTVDLNYLENVRLRRAAVIWRAASFGLSAGLIAAVIFAVSTSRWNRTAEQVVSQQYNNLEQKEHYTQDFDELTNISSSHYIFGLITTRAQHLAVTALINTSPSECFLKLQLTGFRSGKYEIGRMQDGQWVSAHGFEVHEANTLVDIEDISVAEAIAFADGDWEIRDEDNRLIAKIFDVKLT